MNKDRPLAPTNVGRPRRLALRCAQFDYSRGKTQFQSRQLYAITTRGPGGLPVPLNLMYPQASRCRQENTLNFRFVMKTAFVGGHGWKRLSHKLTLPFKMRNIEIEAITGNY